MRGSEEERRCILDILFIISIVSSIGAEKIGDTEVALFNDSGSVFAVKKSIKESSVNGCPNFGL